MSNFFKCALSLFFMVTFLSVQKAKALPADCATSAIQSFSGTWEGSAVLTPPNGLNPQRSGTRDIFVVHDCNSFELTVNYLDAAGKVVRILKLDAVHDGAKEFGLFDVNGTISEGASLTPMVGTLRNPIEGTLLGHFSGAVGGKRAYLSEVMTITGNTLVRTVQMYSGNQDGAYIGTRVVRDLKAQ